MRTTLAAFCLLSLFVIAVRATADEATLTAAVMPTEAAGPALVPVGRALHTALRTALAKEDSISLAAPPKVTYADLQLAVGCLDPTPQCHRAITSQLGVDALVLSSVTPAGKKTRVTVQLIDTRVDGDTKTVQRELNANEPSDRVVDAVPNMVAELVGRSTSQPTVPLEQAPSAPQPVDAERSFPVASVTTGIVGVGLLAAGTGLRIAANNESKRSIDDTNIVVLPGGGVEFELIPTATSSKRKKNASTALFSAGGALIVTAVVLGLTVDKKRNERRAVIMPVLGRRHALLHLSARLGHP